MRGARLGAALVGIGALAAAGAARADFGDLQGTQPGALPNGGNFLDADTCGNCHGNGFMGDKTFLPSDTWAGTMMANSARDPIFKAALALANQDGTPEEAQHCLRCHSPIAFVRGHTTPTDGSAFDAVDLQGVGCEACHRATQTAGPEGPYLLGDAQLVYDGDEGKRGKYDDAISPAHETVPDLGVNDARFCAQCHVVNNPGKTLKDASGVDTGIDFPLETTFGEWEASDYAVPGSPSEATCQKCHMPKKTGDWPLTKLPGGVLRKDPGRHAFVGGNHWGIRAVMEANPERAVQFADAFALAQSETLANLATAVTVELVAAPTAVTPGEAFDVTVRVQNQSGHKFPTGYVDGRRAWIGISLVAPDDGESALLGGYDPVTGTIQASPPTHVYKAVHGRWDGIRGVPEHHLARQDMLLSDTRIPPRGFVASLVTMPSGEIDYADGQGGWKSFDEVTFSVTAPADAHGVQSLSARVYFQSITREYVELLAADNTTNSAGADLLAIYESTDQAPPILIASAEQSLDLGPEPTTASAGGGEGGSGGATTAGTGSGGEGGGPEAGGGEADEGGCSCRTAPGPASPASIGLSLLALAALYRRRRPRARRGVAAKALTGP